MTGVQRYAGELVGALDRLLSRQPQRAGTLRVELLVPPDAAAQPPDLDFITPRQVGRFGGHAWEQATLGASRGGLISLCNTGPIRHRRHIVCIHDMNVRNCPESYSLAFRGLYRMLLPALGRRAVAVATVSDYSAGQLVRYGICDRRRILLTPNGHEHAHRWTPGHSAATQGAADRNTILLIGSPAHHKNIGLILGLSDRLAEAGLRLAVVGNADPRVFGAGRIGKDSARAQWLGRVTDGEMAALLQDALCLAFPSLEEGFGLPPLEAMAIGCPVVASDRASLPEICGDAALYAAPQDPDAWLTRFRALQQSPQLRDTLVARGKARAARFQWAASAERLLQAMDLADGVPAGA